MKKRLTHVRPLDVAKISGAMGLLYSLFLTLMYFVIAGVGMINGKYHGSNVGVGPDAFVILIIAPVVGFVYGAIAAMVFNFVAAVTGGVEFTVNDVPPAASPPPEWPSALPRYPFAPR